MTLTEKRQRKHPDTDTFHYYNANPKNKLTGDCWLRAVCTGLNQDYNQTLREMAEIQIQTGYEMSCNEAVTKYLATKGWVKMKQPKRPDGTKYTGKEFCKELAKPGVRYICNVGGHHMAAIVDKKVNDIWNSTYKTIGIYFVKGE